MVYRYSTVIKLCGLDVAQWSICRTMIYRYSVVVYKCNIVVSYSHSAVVSYSYRYINVVSIGRNYTFVLYAK